MAQEAVTLGDCVNKALVGMSYAPAFVKNVSGNNRMDPLCGLYVHDGDVKRDPPRFVSKDRALALMWGPRDVGESQSDQADAAFSFVDTDPSVGCCWGIWRRTQLLCPVVLPGAQAEPRVVVWTRELRWDSTPGSGPCDKSPYFAPAKQASENAAPVEDRREGRQRGEFDPTPEQDGAWVQLSVTCFTQVRSMWSDGCFWGLIVRVVTGRVPCFSVVYALKRIILVLTVLHPSASGFRV